MEEFLARNQMYIVLFIVLLIWGGIILYLIRLDRKLRNIENSRKKG